jgi:hypothetical protein
LVFALVSSSGSRHLFELNKICGAPAPRHHDAWFTVSLRPDDHADLEELATNLRLSRGEAVRRAIRDALHGRPQPTPESAGDESSFAEEVALQHLVATEQVIKLLERFLPGGAAVTAEVLPEAIGAAQARIAEAVTGETKR